MTPDYTCVSTCEYADALPREQFMDYAIHALWQPHQRLPGLLTPCAVSRVTI